MSQQPISLEGADPPRACCSCPHVYCREGHSARGGSSNSWQLPRCAPAIPTSSSTCPGWAAPAVCHEGPECPTNVGANLPNRPGICPLPGQARTWAALPEAGATPGEGWGWGGGGHQVPPYHGTSLCAPRSYFPPWFSLPWVTQLQLIPIARPGLYLGHGAAQRRRRRGGSRGGGWGVPEAALQEGDGRRGTGDGDRAQDWDCPAPYVSAHQVPGSRRAGAARLT